MGRLARDRDRLFYQFDLDAVVPADHLVRRIDGVLDLNWLHGELAPFYSHTGRPSIDPELMMRMLIIGYVFAIRSERQLCAEVQVNLAYRWFCRITSIGRRSICLFRVKSLLSRFANITVSFGGRLAVSWT